MIEIIYLDMDGVLCDFDTHVDANNLRKETGRCNWKKAGEIGSTFWSEMPWMYDGKNFYKEVVKFAKENSIKLGILSAIFMECGKRGKREWIMKNCPDISLENVLICDKGMFKYELGMPNSVLIDDKYENCDLYKQAGYEAILYTGCEDTMKALKELIEKENSEERYMVFKDYINDM